MKIAIVQSGLLAGGAEKIVNLLAAYRAARGDDVSVLAFVGRREDSYFPYDERIRVFTHQARQVAGGNPLLRVTGRTRWLMRELAALKPDLVISFLTKTNVIVLTAALTARYPVIISERNNPLMQKASPIWQSAVALLANRASSIVMQTESARRSLRSRLQFKSHVIPNPAVVNVPRLPVAVTDQNVIAVGRLDRQKGFDLLIAAFAGTSATPGAWVSAGGIFVLSSRHEGYPNVLVEAMTAGLAAIAFDCPWGPSDIVRDGEDGMLVPVENVASLASAIRRLLTDDPLRTKLAAVERFDEHSVMAQWDDVIGVVLRK